MRMTRGTVQHRQNKNANEQELTQLLLWSHEFGFEFPGGQSEKENTTSCSLLIVPGKIHPFLGGTKLFS